MVAVGRMTAARALWVAVRSARRSGSSGIPARLRAVPRMVSRGFTGRYPHLDRRRMLLALLGIVYVISPVDLVPEILFPVIGLGDDAMVAAWVLGVVLSEADAFLHWERGGRTVPGEVIP